MTRKYIGAAVVVASLALVSTALASGSKTTEPYLSPQARTIIATAPAGSCVANWNQAGCVKPKRVVVLGPNAQAHAQCDVYAFEPERRTDWMTGIAIVNCVGGAQDEGVWAELKMYVRDRHGWERAARSGMDKWNHDGLMRERTWSHCNGGYGRRKDARPWETRAHGFYTINNVLYLQTERSRRVMRYCIHKLG